MTKKSWIISIVILLCAIVSITAFSFVYHSQSGKWFPWWAYAIAIFLFAICVVSCCVFTRRGNDKFYGQLQLLNFDIQRQYKWHNQIFCIDFTSKRIACNLLLKYVIPFQALAGFSAEISDRTRLKILPQDKRNVTLSVSVIVGDDNKSLFHFEMFEVIVNAGDIEEEQQESFEYLVPKYPLMKDLVEMQHDLSRVAGNNIITDF